MSKRNEILHKLMETELDGKVAYVKSGGLFVQGSLEGEVELKYEKIFGLKCLAPIQWNSEKPQEELSKSWTKFKTEDKINAWTKGELLEQAIRKLNELKVQVSSISCYGVKGIDVKMYEGKGKYYTIEYESGSKVEIRITNESLI